MVASQTSTTPARLCPRLGDDARRRVGRAQQHRLAEVPPCGLRPKTRSQGHPAAQDPGVPPESRTPKATPCSRPPTPPDVTLGGHSGPGRYRHSAPTPRSSGHPAGWALRAPVSDACLRSQQRRRVSHPDGDARRQAGHSDLGLSGSPVAPTPHAALSEPSGGTLPSHTPTPPRSRPIPTTSDVTPCGHIMCPLGMTSDVVGMGRAARPFRYRPCAYAPCRAPATTQRKRPSGFRFRMAVFAAANNAGTLLTRRRHSTLRQAVSTQCRPGGMLLPLRQNPRRSLPRPTPRPIRLRKCCRPRPLRTILMLPLILALRVPPPLRLRPTPHASL